MIRVLVVDDSLFMRTIIQDMIGKDPEIEVIAVAQDGIDALKKIDELAPEVMTLDIEMPRMGGLEVLRHRSQYKNFPKTLLLSSLTSKGAEMTREAMELGADDFMLKPKDVIGTRGIERELREKIKNLKNISYQPKREAKPRKISDRIITIGSSAGGPVMLDTLLSSLHSPIDSAIVITQHMPEGGFTASLATRLNRISPMPVKETENNDVLYQGQIYLSKAGYHSVISAMLSEKGETGGKIIHSRSPPLHSVRPAVDKMFMSAASVFGSQCIGVLLSGMGSDGGEGMAKIKEKGGKTIVCQEKDCLVYGMARAALKRECVDQIVPLQSIGDEIIKNLSGMNNHV